MARISGVDLPRTKRIEIGLTYIFGIGRHRANAVLTAAGVDPSVRVKDLTEDDVRKITRVLEEQGGVEGDLRKEISMNIKRLIEIGSYRGGRHRHNRGRLLAAGGRTEEAVWGTELNARKDFATTLPLSVKVGGRYRGQKTDVDTNQTTSVYVGPNGVQGGGDDNLNQFKLANYSHQGFEGR